MAASPLCSSTAEPLGGGLEGTVFVLCCSEDLGSRERKPSEVTVTDCPLLFAQCKLNEASSLAHSLLLCMDRSSL